MVTSVTLGNFYTTGGRTVLGGAGGSGIDTEGLITALVDAKKIPVTKLEDNITKNTTKLKALAEYQTLVGSLKDTADVLRNVPGFAKAAGNAFDYVTASISSNDGTSGSSYMSVSAAPGTTPQTFTINEVTSVAKAKIQKSNNFAIASADTQVVFDSPAAGFFGNGSFTFTRGSDSISITLAEGDTLNNVAAKFNTAAVKAITGVAANVVKISDSSYQLQFTATSTGSVASFDMTPGGGNVTDPNGVFDEITISPVQAASNAEFVLNGETIIRQKNSVDDVISGMTFTILQATPNATELSVEIKEDTVAAKNAIINFLNAYNDIKTFQAKQTFFDESTGTYGADAVLSDNSALRTSINAIVSELNRTVSGIASGNLSRLADVGITLTDIAATTDTPLVRNAVTLDEAKLDSALAANFEQVRKVFEFSAESNNPNLVVFQRSNNLAVTDITLNINPATSTYQAVYTDSSGTHTVNLTGQASGATTYRLTGPTGSPLQGMVLLYTGYSPSTVTTAADPAIAISVTASQTVVRITKASHGLVDGDSVKISDLQGFDGLLAADLNKTFTVTNVTNNTFDITVDGVATSGGIGAVAGGGNTPASLQLLPVVTSTMSFSQGIADRLYNYANDSLLKATTGLLSADVQNIKDSSTRFQDNIDRLNSQIETYRQQLLDKFALLEKIIASTNTLLQSLDAQAKARESS